MEEVQQLSSTGQVTEKKSKWWVLVVIAILVLGIGAYFVLRDESPLEKALKKIDPLTKKSAVELIETADFEGLERAGLTGEETQLIMDEGLVDLEKTDIALKQRTKDIIDEGVRKLEEQQKKLLEN